MYRIKGLENSFLLACMLLFAAACAPAGKLSPWKEGNLW